MIGKFFSMFIFSIIAAVRCLYNLKFFGLFRAQKNPSFNEGFGGIICYLLLRYTTNASAIAPKIAAYVEGSGTAKSLTIMCPFS